MMLKKLTAILLVLSMVLALAACGGGQSNGKETVTVTFDTDGGDAVASQNIEKGSAVVKPGTPKKAGFIFDKWTLNGAEYQFGSAVNENITLKAVWIDPNSGNSGNGSGGSGGSGSSGQTSSSFKAVTKEELNVRKGPGLSYDVVRVLPLGSTVEVFETKTADGYTWNRIGDDEWIADDGTWLEKTSSGGSGGGGSSSSGANPTELYWVNNWYWVQEKCEGDPEWVVKPESLKDQVTFTSSDTSIATVNSKGIVYGVKPGNVTITIKCGNMSDTLPLEVRSASPYISLDTDYLSYDFAPGNVYSHTFTVSFHNGADPNSPVTYTYNRNWDSSGFIIGNTFSIDHVGKYIFTATTAEGYSASCTIEIFGTELCAMLGAYYYKDQQVYKGALGLAEFYYFKNGYSDCTWVSSQCTMINYSGLSYYYDNDMTGYISGYTVPSDHYFTFYDPLNDVYSIEYHLFFDGAY